MASADLDDLSIWDAVGTGVIITTAGGARTGQRSYRPIGSGGNLLKKFLDKSEIYGRVALILPQSFTIRLRNNGTTITQLVIEPTVIQVHRATNVILASVDDVHQNWDCYEFYVKIHASEGIWQIKKNGKLILNAANLNTGTGTINEIFLLSGNSTIVSIYIDDILIDDTNWPGLGGIEVLRPNGAGTYQEWIDSDYTKVNEDNDANYIATDAEVSKRVSFTIPALAVIPKAVGLFTKSQLSGAGAGVIEPYFDNIPQAQLALSTGFQYTENYQIAMPTEVGLKVIV